jgi:hypothetical protein
MVLRLFVGFLLILPIMVSQEAVDGRFLNERVIVVVPLQGTGTDDDPIRPLFAPSKREKDADINQNGIIGYRFVMADDGKNAIVEFVMRKTSAVADLKDKISKRPPGKDEIIKIFERDKNKGKRKGQQVTVQDGVAVSAANAAADEDQKTTIERELKKLKRDFNLESFLFDGIAVPPAYGRRDAQAEGGNNQ